MVWNVFRENFNQKSIVIYNIFNHSGFVQDVKELLKKDISKNEFVERLRLSLYYYFGGRTEHEVVITSWPVYIDKIELDRLNTEYEECNNKWGHYPYKINVALEIGEKVDIYDQVMMNWHQFIEYVWGNKNNSSNMTN